MEYDLYLDACHKIFNKCNEVFELKSQPNTGFYRNFMKFQRKHYKKLNQRSFGAICHSIDPWMRCAVSKPQNVYKKIDRLYRSKCSDDELVIYKEVSVHTGIEEDKVRM